MKAKHISIYNLTGTNSILHLLWIKKIIFKEYKHMVICFDKKGVHLHIHSESLLSYEISA
jgi:hypothetical protein